ncbi:MAG: BatA domain-containing protein, partial [Verrucomicrobia bacterium]|nr:BatA domain-containing protein [Verrucomicrobiota bacterium]
MSFLAPLFLVGALAIVGPILFHMIRRSPEKRRDFSSLIFLEPDPPVFSRRNRISNWILLLLRCLVVALICLAFSRPFFRHEEKTLVAGGLVQHHLVLMDRSASMQRNGLAKSLEAAMDDIIRTLKSGDSILLASFSDQFNVHGDWQAYETGISRDELLSMSESIELTLRSTLLGKSMVQGYQALVDRMAETSSQGFRVSGTIHLISDFQRGAQMDQLQGIEWTENINVVIHSIAGDLPGNAGLSLLSSDRAQILRLQVSNDIESSASTFQVLVKGASEISGAPAGEPRRYPVVVPPGSTRVLSIPLEEISWTHGTAELLGDDASPFDNVVYWSTSTAGSFRLLVHGLGE